MASNTEVKRNNSVKTEANKKNKGSIFDNKFISGLSAFIIGFGIVAVILGGSFYLIVKNNVNGVSEKYRSTLQNIPVIKTALPAAQDPDDPKNLTYSQIKEKYNLLRKENEELKKSINDLNLKNSELQVYKTEDDKNKQDNEAAKKNIEQQNLALDAKSKQITDDKKKLDELIASGDKSGFKEYYEKVDKANAANIYASIIKEQKASDEAKKFVQLYENMDAAAAAKIFEEMGSGKIDLTVDILKNMNKDSASEIMAAMTPTLASKITEKLSGIFLSK